MLNPLLGRGDFLLNVSVDVSSIALIKLCWEKGAMYLDTCIEPWPGGYTDPTVPAGRRTNYALREEALALRPGNARAPTAVLTHGANPGLVSHFVKQALLNIAADTQVRCRQARHRAPTGASSRAGSASRSSTSPSATPRSSRMPKEPGEFVNTWSIDGFVSEGSQPSEMGWGTHERNFPRDGKRHDFGCMAAIYLMQPGAGDARAHLDAARRPLPRLLHHARRGDLDRRLLHGARRCAGRVPADGALRLSPVRLRRSCRCTSLPAATTCSRSASAS